MTMGVRQAKLISKIVLFIVVLGAAANLFACRPAVASENQLEKFWELDIGQDGYALTSTGHILTWNSPEINLNFVVFPASMQSTPARSDSKIIKENGHEYYLWEDTVAWDAENSSGTLYTRSLYWRDGRYAYTLSAEASEPEVSLAFISPGTAAKLEADCHAAPDGYELTGDSWGIGFSKGNVIIGITLQPAPFGEAFLHEFAADPNTVEIEDDDKIYYQNKRDQNPEEPHAVSFMWQTEQGYVWLSGYIPYAHRNDVPGDTLDFINIDLIKSLTAQIEN